MGSRKMLIQKINRQSSTNVIYGTVENLYPSGSKREEIEEKFKNTIHEELKLSSLVSYVGNKNIPFLRIYRYKDGVHPRSFRL